MQSLRLTNHELADLEVSLSKSEFQFIHDAIEIYAKQLGFPHSCGDEDKEFIQTVFSKWHLIKQLNTDNTQQFKDVYALEHNRALNKKEATDG